MSPSRYAGHLWQVVVTLANSGGHDLLNRYRSWIFAGILGFRALHAIPPIVILLGYYGPGPLLPVIGVWIVVVAANLAALPLVMRDRELRREHVLPWLALDLAVAVAVNLWGAAMVPGSVNEPYHDLFWFWAMGTVMLWTAWYGGAVGSAIALSAVPLQLAMTGLSDPSPAAEAVPMIVGRTVWLLVGVLGGVLFLATMRVASRGVLAEGERAGRQSEQLRILRELHDTALQTLEAIGLTASDARVAPVTRLDAVRSAARAQAKELRVALTTSSDLSATDRPADPLAELASVVRVAADTMERAGVQVRMQDWRLTGVRILRTRSDALGSGVREALSNVHRHAAASSAVVRAVALADRIEVTVRDDGSGFAPSHANGFGIRQSIVARLEEVGGGAEIRSGPRRGTAVRMWVPR
jgi:signal transduction histidine kinase